MANKTIYLIKFRRAVAQRAHFAIYIHEGAFPGQGTLIHVVGAPMAGYSLEIRANYNLAATTQRYTAHRLGEIPTSLAATMQQLASTVRPPGVSQNFMGPVDGVNNRRCQEWTADYVQLLVNRHLLSQTARDILQNERDPPNFGIGLNPVGAGGGQGRGRGRGGH